MNKKRSKLKRGERGGGGEWKGSGTKGKHLHNISWKWRGASGGKRERNNFNHMITIATVSSKPCQNCFYSFCIASSLTSRF